MPLTLQSSATFAGITIPSTDSGIPASKTVDVGGILHVQAVTVPAGQTVALGIGWLIARVVGGVFAANGPLLLETDSSSSPTESHTLSAGVETYPSAAAFPFTEDATSLHITNPGSDDVKFEALVGLDVTQ